MKKISLLSILIIIVMSAYPKIHNRIGIGNFNSSDTRETVINKLYDQQCKSITTEHCTDNRTYIITGEKYSFTFNYKIFKCPRISGDIIIIFNKNNISEINFIVDKTNIDKYIDYLNEKYFPNIDSDVRWWNKNITITKSKNYIFTYKYFE